MQRHSESELLLADVSAKPMRVTLNRDTRNASRRRGDAMPGHGYLTVSGGTCGGSISTRPRGATVSRGGSSCRTGESAHDAVANVLAAQRNSMIPAIAATRRRTVFMQHLLQIRQRDVPHRRRRGRAHIATRHRGALSSQGGGPERARRIHNGHTHAGDATVPRPCVHAFCPGARSGQCADALSRRREPHRTCARLPTRAR